MSVTVVVNCWGGVPSALHENFVHSLRSSLHAHVTTGVPLTRFDQVSGFRAVIGMDEEPVFSPHHAATRQTVFQEARNAGYRVVVLGASGIDAGRDPARPPEHMREPMDPRTSMSHVGADLCSLHDIAHVRGTPAAYDMDVFREAQSIVDAHTRTSQPLLLWLNLLCCAGLKSMRTSASAPPLRDAVDISGETEGAFRNIPVPRRQLASSPALVQLRKALAREERALFGETSDAREITDSQYAKLLNAGWLSLLAVQTAVSDLVQSTQHAARRAHAQCSFAVTSTHSFGLGESGIRAAGPFVDNASSFFVTSRPSAPEGAHGRTLPQLLRAFLLGVEEEPLPAVCIGQAADAVAARVTCQLRDRSYACVVAWRPLHASSSRVSLGEALLCAVFERSEDPEESQDILQHLGHIVDELKVCLRRVLPTHVVVRPSPLALHASRTHNPVVQLESRPALTPVEVTPSLGRAQDVQSEPSLRNVPPPIAAATSASVYPLSESRSATPRVADARSGMARNASRVRMKESRLNTLHR